MVESLASAKNLQAPVACGHYGDGEVNNLIGALNYVWER